MFKVFTIFLAIGIALSNATPNRRIVGGGNVIPGELPHQVSLRFWGNNFHFAGGALITNRWVVSAANYLDGRAQNSVGIFSGATLLNANINMFQSDTIIVHTSFERVDNLNNIALVRSATLIPMTHLANIIALGATFIGAGVNARVSGWGATNPNKGPDSNILQARNVITSACEANGHFAPNNQQHLCADTAVCTTDIGGPLVASNELIGISTWHDPEVCGSEESQDYYLRVSTFRTWIMSNID